MNLAFLLPEYPHPKINTHCGGIGTSAKNLATGLVMNSHKLTIFVYGQDKDELFYDGLIEIH
ncbi:MAG: glycosyltransferase family 4 protein, partial [Flavobacteriia bacterium]|nr:glycosyltransferase family 4 protein [Flavobacteriia bacterium]